MAEHTANYNLEKQQENEFIDIQGINSNFDIIDARLKKNNQDNYRPNMLINGDFQIWYKNKALSIVNGTGEHIADKWIVFGGKDANFSISQVQSGLRISSYTGSTYRAVTQRFNITDSYITNVIDKVVTLSASIDNETYSRTFQFVDGADTVLSGFTPFAYIVANALDSTRIGFISIAFEDNIEHIINWVKLEVNDHASTFIPKSYKEELLNCSDNVGYAPNLLINGDFQIWQRGTSFANMAGVSYTADRWRLEAGANGLSSCIRYLDTGGVSCMRVSTSDYANINYLIEQTDIDKIKGKIVTLSFFIRIISGTFANAILRLLNKTINANALTAGEWTKITLTDIVPLDATTLNIFLPHFEIANSSAVTFDLRDIKLEVNDHATPFIPRSYGEELAMCKRYYEAGDVSFALAKGVVYEPLSKFNVEKRITPTLTYQAPTDVNNIPISQIVGATYPRTTTVGAIELSGVAQYPIINIKYKADAEI